MQNSLRGELDSISENYSSQVFDFNKEVDLIVATVHKEEVENEKTDENSNSIHLVNHMHFSQETFNKVEEYFQKYCGPIKQEQPDYFKHCGDKRKASETLESRKFVYDRKAFLFSEDTLNSEFETSDKK